MDRKIKRIHNNFLLKKMEILTEEEKLGKLRSAGVICISIHPKNGNVMFLLAKERENEGWKQGSCKWTFFGGGANPNESGFDCAKREFQEESLGLTTPLCPGEYIFELKLCTQCQSLPQFLHHKKKLKSTEKKSQDSETKNEELDPERLEKQKVLIPFEEKHVDASLSPLSSSFSSSSSSSCEKLSPSSPKVVEISSPEKASVLFTEQAYFNSAEHFHSPQFKMKMWKHEVLYGKWIDWQPFLPLTFLQTRNKLMEYYHLFKTWKKNMIKEEDCIQQLQHLKEKFKNFTHPALHVEYTESMITHFQVKEEYLEINEIRWWTFDEVSQLVKRKGYYRGEKARTSKLPLLYAVLKKIEQMMKIKK